MNSSGENTNLRRLFTPVGGGVGSVLLGQHVKVRVEESKEMKF